MRAAFSRVIGHAGVKRTLEETLRGRAASALRGSFIFAGPEGVGRALLARELAAALFCRQAGDGEGLPCGSCPPCGRVERGQHPDLVWIRPDGASIGVNAVHEALEELARAPVEAPARVFVFDPASALTEDAQNALLKALEEPPARALLVLVAAREDELLPTIASRCRVVRLDELAPAEVEAALLRAGLDRPQAAARARWAGGSPGRALAEDALLVAELADEALRALASGAAYADPMGTVDLLARSVDRGSPEPAVRRRRLLELVRVLHRAVRDALVLGATGGEPVRLLSGATAAELRPLAALPSPRLERASETLGRAEEEVAQNVNPSLVLEGLVLDVGEALAPAAPASSKLVATGGGARTGQRSRE